MSQPLSRALQGHEGNYDSLFRPGQNLLRDLKKGWVISRAPVSARNQAVFFENLVAALVLENFSDVRNPEDLAKRINVICTRPPVLKTLPDPVLFKSSSETFAFLSNFFPSLIVYNGKLFRSSEHLYQWRIVTFLEPDLANDHFARMRDLDALKSRKYCHEVQAHSDKAVEEGTKLEIMQEVAVIKFVQNPVLAEALVATDPSSLVENTESPFWGGETNHMGRILEATRTLFLPTKD
ncbi:MAG: NADAR family protein [Simkaniaceae bacterium]|nr:MAG: NADAR family protein [Simkaniaceae bacterium]